MSSEWADRSAERLLKAGLVRVGVNLILGASDTGKTTLASALTKEATVKWSVAVVDADIGQSHIGPPTTVGWAVVCGEEFDFLQLAVGGISFVGDVTPVGHLLQLTTAIAQCVEAASEAGEVVIVDTGGFVSGPAACALWWAVERMVGPVSIIAVERGDELAGILSGLCGGDKVELVESPAGMPTKSPQERKRFRARRFAEYFGDCRSYDIELDKVSVQGGRGLEGDEFVNRVAALRDGRGVDIAVGLVSDWGKEVAVVRAPRVDIGQVGCIVIGDVVVEVGDE